MIAYRIYNDATDETVGYYENETEAKEAAEVDCEFHQSGDWRYGEIDISMSPVGFLAELDHTKRDLNEAIRQRGIFARALEIVFEASGLTSLVLERAVDRATEDVDDEQG